MALPRKIQKYGWQKDLPDYRDHVLSIAPRAEGAAWVPPAKVDLRPHCPPVYDQGQLGSCTGNSIAGALEFQYKRQGLTDVTPSRLFIYYNERAIEGTIGSDSGAQIRDGIKSVNLLGDCPESEWPYDISKFTIKPPANCYADAAKEVVLNYAAVPQNITHIKDCLSYGLPFVFGFTVYSGFESQEVANTGVLNLPTRDESVVGGHAVLCVGYDDTTQRVIVRNSWGAEWGQAGYFTMPYSYILNPNLASDFWAIKLIK